MNKWFKCCGFFAIVAVLLTCTLSVSAKEKHSKKVYNKCYTVENSVSRETIDSQSFDLTKHIPGNDFGIVTYAYFEIFPEVFNDPYLERSQRWLRENNFTANSRNYDSKRRATQPLLHQKLSC